MSFVYLIDALSGFEPWKAASNKLEKEVYIDVIISYCEVDIAGIQFPIRMLYNFLELFHDI